MRWVEISISAVWLFCWKYMTLGYQSYHWTMHNFIADVRRGEIWENWSRKQFAFFHGRTEKGTKSNIFAYKLCAWKLLVVMYRSNRSFNMPPPGIPRAFDTFDTFAVLGRREFDYQSLPGGGEFDPHALGMGNLNCALDFI